MPDTPNTRVLMLCVLATLLPATAAGAAPIPVLGGDGEVTERPAPGVAATDPAPALPAPRPAHRRERGTTAPLAAHRSAHRTGAHAARRTTTSELRRLRRSFPQEAGAAASAYRRVRSLGRRLAGRRGVELRGVAATVDGIAARGKLTASRLPVLTLTLQRNAQWWGGDGSLLASGARVSFAGSELVWQSVPGQGIQFHPLANFGLLNALFRQRLAGTRMNRLLDELLAIRAARAGGTAWEYYYAFDGGRPPWVSSLAQGTGLQATARAATKALRPDVLPTLQSGLAIFQSRPPEGVRVPFPGGGDHYAQYSFWPSLRIANGFAQSLVGLYDFAALSGSPTADRLFEAGMTAARKDLPTFDTGAWSLYSRGAIQRESDAHYHDVLIDFATSLCERTDDAGVCGLVQRWTAEKTVAPTLSLVTRQLRAGARGTVRVRLSKLARLRVQLRRGGKLVYDSSSLQGYGTRSFSVTPPRSTRAYDVLLSATDVSGNAAEPVEGTIRVLAPRARK